MDAKVAELSSWIMRETKWTGQQWDDIFTKGLINPSELCSLITHDIQFSEIVFNQIITGKSDLATPQGDLTLQEWQTLLRKYPQDTAVQKFEAVYKEINDTKYSAVIGCCLAHMMEGKAASIPTTLTQSDLLELIDMVRIGRRKLQSQYFMLSQFLIVGQGRIPTLCQSARTMEGACKVIQQSILEVFVLPLLETASPMSDATFNQLCKHDTLVTYVYKVMMRDKNQNTTLEVLNVTPDEFLEVSWQQILELTEMTRDQVIAVVQKNQHKSIAQLHREARYHLDSPSLAHYIYQKVSQPQQLSELLFRRLDSMWRYRQEVCDIM